jgi:WXG100 family type VII secretion target
MHSERSIIMAGQIRMTPEQMRVRANEYSTEAGKVQETIGKMDQLLNALQGEWEGAAAESYAQRFTELRPGFVKAKELIDEIAKALQDTARIVEETDQNIAAQFRG